MFIIKSLETKGLKKGTLSERDTRICLFNSLFKNTLFGILGGSGYLGYVDSNQGYNPYKWLICTLTRGINLHKTSY